MPHDMYMYGFPCSFTYPWPCVTIQWGVCLTRSDLSIFNAVMCFPFELKFLTAEVLTVIFGAFFMPYVYLLFDRSLCAT